MQLKNGMEREDASKQEKRHDLPAMLLLRRERVLVCGDFGGTRTAELLQLSCNHNVKGVWTLVSQPVLTFYDGIIIVKLNHRIVAVGE